MTKMLPVRYKSYIDRVKSTTTFEIPVEVQDEQIKEYINRWLFQDKYNYILIFYKNELWMVELDSSNTYCKKRIDYHPLKHLFELTIVQNTLHSK